jgi:hypothetical protein
MTEIKEIEPLELDRLLRDHKETEWARGFLDAPFVFESYADTDRLAIGLVQIGYPWAAGFIINGQTWEFQSFTINGLDLPMENIDGLEPAVRNEIKQRLVALRESIQVKPPEAQTAVGELEKVVCIGGPADGKEIIVDRYQPFIYFLHDTGPIKYIGQDDIKPTRRHRYSYRNGNYHYDGLE